MKNRRPKKASPNYFRRRPSKARAPSVAKSDELNSGTTEFAVAVDPLKLKIEGSSAKVTPFTTISAPCSVNSAREGKVS